MEIFLAKINRFKPLICLLFIFFITAGIYSLLHIPIDAFPDLTNNQVQVFTEAPGMGPIEVEQLITIPLESTMNGLPSVQQIRSISKYGLSVVTVVFQDNLGTYFPRQIVSERLQAARSRLPDKVEPQLGPVSTALGEVYQYVVQSPVYSPTDLRTMQEWDIKYALRTVPGVAEVNTWGGLTDEYLITLSPSKLQLYGLSIQEVLEALKDNNGNFGAGIINHESEQYIVRGLGRAESIPDIENIVIKTVNGIPIYVKSIGTVGHGAQLRQGAATKDGLGEVVVGLVMMLKGENSQRVITRVKEKMVEISRHLPEGVKLIPFYDQSKLVQQTIDTVRTNLFEGGLLVVAVLFLTVGNIPAALIVTSVIPLAMTFSFLGMRCTGVTANIMSLGAIDFGMIVDGSIVMAENILRNLNNDQLNHLSKQEIIEKSIAEVARPILFGILIITVVYLPILCLEGIEYKMFSPMVITVCSALFGSLLLSLLLVPVLCAFFLKRHTNEKETALIKTAKTHYNKLLDLALGHKRTTIYIALALLILSIIAIFFTGTEFVPKLDEGDLLLEVKEFPSISLPAAIDTATQVEKVIKRYPEVKTVVSRLGRPELATDPMGVFGTDCFIMLKPKKLWTPGMTKEHLIETLRKELNDSIPGATFNFTQPIEMRVDELVSGVRSEIAIKLFGENIDYLQQKAEEIQKVIAKVRGTIDLQVEQLTGSAQIEVIPDRVKLARYGANIKDIRTVLQAAIIGISETQVIKGRKRFDIRLQFPKGLNLEPTDVGNLLVQTSTGKLIPLSQIAEIKIGQTLETINREFGQRRIIIQCNVRNRDIGSFVQECQSRIAQSVHLDKGYRITWGGQFANQQRAMNKFMIVVPLSILIIFTLLIFTFNSAKPALVVLLNVPFALIGGVFALLLRQMYLSVPASIGFIALFGVAVLNGLVLVSYISKLVEQGLPVHEAVKQGSIARLRPVLMTALVAALGFLPMALSHGSGAEVQKPLATVVIGGLCTSTLLTLLVLPVVYEWVFAKTGSKRQTETA